MYDNLTYLVRLIYNFFDNNNLYTRIISQLDKKID